ncbi:MAG: hypothetical protein IPH95_01975 [Candidatus Promineofilum sp.]|nr:hypothetical protein [Promineifilum sp.]
MEPLPVDVFQLQRRDPVAWTVLLSRVPELADVIVTAVNAEPLWDTALVTPGRAKVERAHHMRRYILTLAGSSDPISFIAKQTNAAEALVYQALGDPAATGIVPCHYAHVDGDAGWVILADVPDHFPPATWQPQHADAAIATLARIHAAHWQTGLAGDATLPHFLHRPEGPYPWEALQRDHLPLFEDGPGAILSRHAVRHAGRLAPRLLEAANGLVVLRDLGGWPGVLGESHLAAAADLLDDPVPLLAALDDLPDTLLHGAPHPGHWRLTLFEEQYLIDWSTAQLGPGVLDLVGFLERYPLLYDRSDDQTGEEARPRLRLRDVSPLFEETAIDTYLLTLSVEMGRRFSARAFRAAVPAARCLHVLTTWFPFFAQWIDDMPGKYVWQRVNRLSEAELAHYHVGPMAGMRPYLAGVFERFLRAYRSL